MQWREAPKTFKHHYLFTFPVFDVTTSVKITNGTSPYRGSGHCVCLKGMMPQCHQNVERVGRCKRRSLCTSSFHERQPPPEQLHSAPWQYQTLGDREPCEAAHFWWQHLGVQNSYPNVSRASLPPLREQGTEAVRMIICFYPFERLGRGVTVEHSTRGVASDSLAMRQVHMFRRPRLRKAQRGHQEAQSSFAVVAVRLHKARMTWCVKKISSI